MPHLRDFLATPLPPWTHFQLGKVTWMLCFYVHPYYYCFVCINITNFMLDYQIHYTLHIPTLKHFFLLQ